MSGSKTTPSLSPSGSEVDAPADVVEESRFQQSVPVELLFPSQLPEEEFAMWSGGKCPAEPMEEDSESSAEADLAGYLSTFHLTVDEQIRICRAYANYLVACNPKPPRSDKGKTHKRRRAASAE